MISSPSPCFGESPVEVGAGRGRWAHEPCACGGSHSACNRESARANSTLMGVVTGA
jgi:hypothetical protein